MPSTIRLHRVLRAPAERIYRAFLDPVAMVKWLPPHGYTAQVQEMDARIGGRYRMSFSNFSNGTRHSFSGQYQALLPYERICYTDRFDDPGLPGEIRVTVELEAVPCGTEMKITQEGVPDAIPAQACYLGWQESLLQLAQLVEPDIPEEG